MKKISILLTFVFAFVISSVQVLAAEDIISAKEFSSFKKANKNLVIIDARQAADYAKMHIMKAVNVPHKELYKEGAVEGLIKDPADLATYFGKKGVTTDAPIVIYDEGSSKYASRVYWVLKYLGAENVKILHKDMNKWKVARIPLTKAATPSKKKTFTPSVNAAIFATMADVKALNGVLIDCRDANEFDGSAEKSKGHIPGAVHINYKDVLKANGSFKSKVEMEAYAAKHNLSADKEIICYCVTSVRAAVTYTALTNILGYTNVKVYDGAYNEWITSNDVN